MPTDRQYPQTNEGRVAVAMEILANTIADDPSEYGTDEFQSELESFARALRDGNFDLDSWAIGQDLCLKCERWTGLCKCDD